MSLKAFHIFFMFSCVLILAAFGAIEIGGYFFYPAPDRFILGSIFLLSAGVLIAYLFWFRHKMKKVTLS